MKCGCGCGVRPLYNHGAHTCACGMNLGVRVTRKTVATHSLEKRLFSMRYPVFYEYESWAEVLAPRSRLTRQFWWWLLHQFWHNFECQNNSATTHAIISYLPEQAIVKIYCKLGFDPISYLVLYRIVLDTIKSFLWRKCYFVQTFYCNPQLIFAKLKFWGRNLISMSITVHSCFNTSFQNIRWIADHFHTKHADLIYNRDSSNSPNMFVLLNWPPRLLCTAWKFYYPSLSSPLNYPCHWVVYQKRIVPTFKYK